jgi:monoamine oxidase
VTEVDVAIVGGGAAGIAAGRHLCGTGVSSIALEAGARLGGRAHTVLSNGLPLDLGCAWLHSADRNPWVEIAASEGFEIDRAPPPWGRQAGNRGFTPTEQAAAWEAYRSLFRRLRHAPPASDRAADALIPGEPWNGRLQALSGYINGAPLDIVSIRDFLAYEDADTGVNWRIPSGYGALVAHSGRHLRVALGTRVTSIDASAARLRIDTTAGTLSARAAIVTVSTAILAAGSLRLPSELDAWCEAAARLPLGYAEKIFFAVAAPEAFEANSQVIGRPRSAQSGSYHLRPFGRPVIEAFFGGDGAKAVAAAGAEGGAAIARDELTGLFGSGVCRGLRPVARSSWLNDPFIGGSYSHTLPGLSQARQILAVPYENRIFFAGEACSREDFSTAHGAYATGAAAAAAALKALDR